MKVYKKYDEYIHKMRPTSLIVVTSAKENQAGLFELYKRCLSIFIATKGAPPIVKYNVHVTNLLKGRQG